MCMMARTGTRQNDMVTIGITGGVGCGKSKILEYIREHYNSRVILADDVANKIKEPGEACYKPLIELLGEDIVGVDSFIDKKIMASKIFNNDELLEKVDGILHPAVKDYFLEQKRLETEKGTIDYLFLEAALLIECGYKEYVDEMWYIYAPEEVRADRLRKSRGYSNDKIKAIMAAQLSEEQFRQGSDFVIDNGGSLEYFYEQISNKIKGLTDGR